MVATHRTNDHNRTDNAVKNRWAALCRKDPSLVDDYGEPSPMKRLGKRRQRDSLTLDTSAVDVVAPGVGGGSMLSCSQVMGTPASTLTPMTLTTGGMMVLSSMVVTHPTRGLTALPSSAWVQRYVCWKSTATFGCCLIRVLTYIDPQLARQLHAIDPMLLTSNILDGAEGALGPPGSPHDDGSTSSAYQPTSRMLESPMTCHTGPGLITTMMTSCQRDVFYAKQRQLRAMNIAHMGLQNQVNVDVLALHVPRIGTPGTF